jgi:hypothetical protein
MLTLKVISQETEKVLKGLEKKHFKNAEETIGKVLELDKERRAAQQELDNVLAQNKQLAAKIGQLMKAGSVDEANAVKAEVATLKDKAKEFILNPYDDPNLPEKEVKEIEMPDGSKWAYPISQGVISLQNTRETDYEVYIRVQNELTRAFNEVRDEVSKMKFGKKFADLEKEQSSVITKAIPLKISEAEPRNMAKK